MNSFSRAILPIAALVISAGSLFAADEVELKQRWMVGKKYSQTIQVQQSITMSIAGQAMQSTVTTMDISQAVRAQADGKGKRMTLKFDRVAMEISMGGMKISFDSSKPGEGSDPLGIGKTFVNTVGKELNILLSENDEITGLENYDEFIKMPGTSSTPGMDMSKMFSKDSIAQMIKGRGLQAMPGHPVKPGDSWPFTSIEHPQDGKVDIAGNYVLKGMATRDGNQVAEIAADAKLSMDSSGPNTTGQLAQLGKKVEVGTVKGTIYFDPKLGFARGSDMVTEMTMPIKDPTDPSATISVPIKQTIDTKLTSVEDVK
jgi:hypothetical protein